MQRKVRQQAAQTQFSAHEADMSKLVQTVSRAVQRSWQGPWVGVWKANSFIIVRLQLALSEIPAQGEVQRRKVQK